MFNFTNQKGHAVKLQFVKPVDDKLMEMEVSPGNSVGLTNEQVAGGIEVVEPAAVEEAQAAGQQSE